MSKILIVEDDPVIRQTVEYALRRAGFETTACDNGSAALKIANAVKPDLILLDLMLPGMHGYAFSQAFRASDKDTAIIIVTALDDEGEKIRGLDAGADDYITKPFSTEELLARVRANLRRVRGNETLEKHEAIEAGDLLIEPGELRVSVAGNEVRLRLKEFQLLVALASHSGALRTRQHLAQEVWGYDFLSSSRTIDVHVRRVRQAVEGPSRYTYVHTVHGMGYRFEPVPKSEVTDL